jgi:hypothetical protein
LLAWEQLELILDELENSPNLMTIQVKNVQFHCEDDLRDIFDLAFGEGTSERRHLSNISIRLDDLSQ